MNYKSQIMAVWMGPLGLTLAFPSLFLLMHFLPPLDPNLSALETASIYRGNDVGIIVGGLVFQLSACFLLFFFAVYSLFIAKSESPSRLWTYGLLMMSAMGYATLVVAETCFCMAAYRVDRPDAVIQALSDVAFTFLVGASLPGAAQMFAAAGAILADRSPVGVLPRWLGFVSLWGGILEIPGVFVPLMKTGPLTWKGIIGFWIPAVAYGLWIGLSAWELRKAIIKESNAVAR